MTERGDSFFGFLGLELIFYRQNRRKKAPIYNTVIHLAILAGDGQENELLIQLEASVKLGINPLET